MNKIVDNFKKSQLGQSIDSIDWDDRTPQERMLDFKNSQGSVDNRPMADKIAELETPIDKTAENLKDPSFGDGSMLARPQDTSIQGASEDFMDFLRNPTNEGYLNNKVYNPSDRSTYVALKGNGTPDLSQITPVVAPQNVGTSTKGGISGSFKGSSTSSDGPPNTIPQADILLQLKAAREANEASMLAARRADESTNFGNTLSKSGAKFAEAMANITGTTNIKLTPSQDEAKEVEFAGNANKSKLEALMQDYGITKGIDDTTYNRKKDTDTRNDRLADSKFDRQYKNRMLAITEGKSNAENNDSVGQKELDKKFASDYNKFTSSGFVNATKGIQKLKDQRKMIESENEEWFGAGGGSFWASLPDSIRDNESVKMRDITVTLANNALKDTFGGQLSDKEREAKANEFYNDKLSPKDNMDILDTKLAELEDSLKVQRQKAEFFQKNNKSLRGFESNFSVENDNNSKSLPTLGQIINSGGKRYKVINDNGDLEEVK